MDAQELTLHQIQLSAATVYEDVSHYSLGVDLIEKEKVTFFFLIL